MIMLPIRRLSAVAIACAASLLTPATPADAGVTPDQVVAAYRTDDVIYSEAQVDLASKDGRWTVNNQTAYRVAIDRKGDRLALSHPAFHLVVADQQLVLSSAQLPGVYLDQPMPGPVTYDKLAADAPPVDEMIALPDLILATDDQPWARLLGADDPADIQWSDGQGDHQLIATSGNRTATIDVDPGPGRLTRLVIDNSGPSFGQPVKLTYTYAPFTPEPGVDPFQPPIPQDAEPVATFAELLQPRAPQPGGQPAGGPHALVGQPSPDFDLALLDGGRLTLANATSQADVVILDFWATWCPPCVAAMPELDKLQQWAKDNHKSVAVYAINLGENPQTINPFLKQHGLGLTVAMDPQGQSAQAFQVSGIPQTVVIGPDGKVAAVHVGFSTGYGQQLRDDINKLIP